MAAFHFNANVNDAPQFPHVQQSDATTSPNFDDVIAAEPITWVSPDGEVIYSTKSSTYGGATTTDPGIATSSISEPFNFTLPDACFASLLRIEPIMRVQSATIKHKKLRRWVDLRERLTGWRVEKSPRSNGRFDKFYHHPCMKKVRAVTQVQFFIKYGFVPVNGTGKRKRSTDEPSTEETTEPEQKDKKFLICMEKKLIAGYEYMADISLMVNTSITDQLKITPSPPDW